MRKPRRLLPGQMYDVTVRCNRGEFRFLPTKERRDCVAFFLAKAKARYPGIQLACICQMSNHIHLVLRDREAQLADFMRDFLGHLAKSINRIDQVRGTLFERRYTAIPILDMEAAVRRIVYAITNPVDAGLVRSHREWSGLCAWFEGFTAETITYFHQGKYKRTVKDAERTGAYVPRADFDEVAVLDLDAIDGLDPEVIREAIEAREAELKKDHPKVMGMRKVLAQSPFGHPKMPKRRAMPLCLFSTRAAKEVFFAEWFHFLDMYRQASAAFRAGNLAALFPMFSFRPITAAT